MGTERDIQSLCGLLSQSVERFANRPLFLRKSGGVWRATSYGEFGAMVRDLAAGLSSLGVTRGDRVAVISGNSVEWAAIAHASYSLGAALVPMYESQRESDWKFIVRDSGAKVLFCSTPEIFAKVSGFSADAPKLKHVTCIAGSYAAILAEGRQQPVSLPSVASEDTATLLYTSGTTGEPKGVVLSHGNILANVLALQTIIQGTIPRPEEHRALSFLPWAHAFGHTVELQALLACGACMALAESVEKVVDNIREVRPTVLVAVPTVFMRIHAGVEKLMAARPRPVRWLFRRGVELANLRRRGQLQGALARALLAFADLLIFAKIRARFGGRLRFAICGAAALPRETGELIDAMGITVYEGYGLTETSPIVSANTPGARKLGSAGRPLPGVRVVIDESVDPAREGGEIIVFGPNVMQGYHGRDAENRRVLVAGRGLRTGDLGYLDRDGFLFVTGRIKEQYKLTNGKYVAPAPIEDRLRLSPFIDNAMVYGDGKPHNVALLVPNAEAVQSFASARGLVIRDFPALLELAEVREVFARELERLCRALKGYEKVREFAFVLEPFSQESGTLTPSLKLKRHEIMRRFGGLLDSLYPPRLESLGQSEQLAGLGS